MMIAIKVLVQDILVSVISVYAAQYDNSQKDNFYAGLIMLLKI